MKTFLIAASMIVLFVSPVLAGSKHNVDQFENWQHNQDQTYNYNYNYNYKYKNNNGDWYENPNVWAPIVGGLLGGLVERSAPPPQYYEYEYPPCRAVIMPVFVPSLGIYRKMPVQVCD